MDEKETLHRYLRLRRDDLLAKLDGLDEYDVRRPLTPTGTSLLGLVKHVAGVELEYFGDVFGRAPERRPPWLGPDAEPDADMWVPAGQSRAEVVELHHEAAAHTDATIDALSLDTPGVVPWWGPQRQDVTLHQILVHMCVETARHAGHADILRELLDGRAGNGAADPNLPVRSAGEWGAYRSRIEQAAQEARRTSAGTV